MPPEGGTTNAVPFSELTGLLTLLCDGDLGQAEWERLEALLLDDPAAQEFYRRFIGVDVDLAWRAARVRGDVQEVSKSEIPDQQVPVGAAVELPIIPPIIIDTDCPPFSRLPPSLAAWLFSYAAATVITGTAILGAWVYRVSHDYQLAASSPAAVRPAEKNVNPELEVVGRIAGAFDCRCSDPRAVAPGAPITLGHRYDLASGLLEISYRSGAKVILQGPCTYEVDSAAGGFLSLGKLTARVEKSEIRNPKSEAPNPQSLIPNPLFCIRTPTAVVTDLGTEFGVEVDKSGGTHSHVFRGRVVLRLAGGRQQNNRPIPLGENESASVEAGQEHVVTVTRASSGARGPDGFARHMPKWVRIELFNTGLGLKEGDPDRHWQIVAVGNDPRFQPRPAVVTATPGTSAWLFNQPRQSQWLSTANGPPELPNVMYTFRTTFELADLAPDKATLHGKFIADNYVSAIRLNGKQLPVPEQSDVWPFDRFSEFSATKGFVEGTNTLEFDVANGARVGEVTDHGPMGLLVELSGCFLSAGKAPVPAEAGRKD